MSDALRRLRDLLADARLLRFPFIDQNSHPSDSIDQPLKERRVAKLRALVLFYGRLQEMVYAVEFQQRSAFRRVLPATFITAPSAVHCLLQPFFLPRTGHV